MEPKQLKATLQLAQMRFDSDPSEANKAILAQAKKDYNTSVKSQSPKIKQVSGKTVNPIAPEDTTGAGDVTGDADPANNTGDESGEQNEPSTNTESDGAAGESQKKTDLAGQAE